MQTAMYHFTWWFGHALIVSFECSCLEVYSTERWSCVVMVCLRSAAKCTLVRWVGWCLGKNQCTSCGTSIYFQDKVGPFPVLWLLTPPCDHSLSQWCHEVKSLGTPPSWSLQFLDFQPPKLWARYISFFSWSIQPQVVYYSHDVSYIG